MCIAILGSIDIDAIGGAGSSTEKASHALLQPVFIPMKNVDAAITGLKMDRFVRIILCDGLPPQIAKCDAETFDQRRHRFSDVREG